MTKIMLKSENNKLGCMTITNCKLSLMHETAYAGWYVEVTEL